MQKWACRGGHAEVGRRRWVGRGGRAEVGMPSYLHKNLLFSHHFQGLQGAREVIRKVLRRVCTFMGNKAY